MTENWYLILELEFEPNPIVDEAVIRQRIREKQKFWSSKANDFNHGSEYKNNMLLCKDENAIVADIQNDDIRAEMVKDACEKRYGLIDKTLKRMLKSELSEETIKRVADKNKFDLDVVKERMKVLNIKLIQSKEENYQEIYEKYYKKKPQNADKYNVMKAFFAPFNVDNLYDFLALNTTQKNIQNLPSDNLRQLAKEKKKKEFYKNDAISSAGAKLCRQCEECFKDEKEKQTYDQYRGYIKRKELLDELKDLYDYIGEITPEIYKKKVGQLTEILKNRKEAEKLIAAFCRVEKIPLALPVTETSAKNKNMKICRCGCINDISDGRKVCKRCGMPLEIKCPKCGKINDADINVCKCGFRFENLDKSVALCEQAEKAVDNMEFAAAEVHLADAARYWKENERIPKIKARLTDLKQRVGAVVDDLKKACKQKNYYEAKKYYENIKKFSEGFSDPAIEEEIDTAIAEAAKYKKIAQISKKESEIIEACAAAYEKCNDCPGIKGIIAKYPPQEPTGLKISCDVHTKVNVISWTRSATQGLIYYNVVRKEDAIPLGVQDGTLVGRVSMCSINDQNILPGSKYFYAVFAERAGVFSAPLVIQEPVMNLFEISGVKTAAGDGTLQFSWEPIAQNASVMIERTDDTGRKTRLECNSRKTFVDKGLKNDVEYYYKVFLQYMIGNKKLLTKGINLSGIPTRPPLPIEKLVVKPGEGSEFKVEWENPKKQEIQFFYSTKRPDYLPGDIVPLATLEAAMESLVIRKNTDTSGTFRYEKDEIIYVLVVAVRSGSAVIGTIARASRGGAVKVKSAVLVNGKIMLGVDFPKNTTGFVVLYRHDQFPENISDTQATRKYIPLKQYQYDCGLVIDSNEPENYYFSVFAQYKIDGESDYSEGTDYLFSNVSKEILTYSISVKKKLFGQNQVILNFETDSKKACLPAIDVISATDRAPMFKKSGNLFYQIESQEMNGPVQISIPLDKKVPRETYIKPFLRDENLSGRYVLKIKLGSDHKIS